MAKRKKQPVQNQTLAVVRTPLFKQRRVKDKTNYSRRVKHQERFAKLLIFSKNLVNHFRA